MRVLLGLLSYAVLGATIAWAQTLRETPNLAIRITQDGKPVGMQVAGDGAARATLSRGAFTITYPDGMLNVCAWTDDSIYDKARMGTDTMQDFNSCMFIYKSTAMHDDASYLILSQENGFSLNLDHGAKKLSDKRAGYKVTHVQREGSPDVQLDELDRDLYLALWLDGNKNQVIDNGELERLVLMFQ